jgi:hypothetical protein
MTKSKHEEIHEATERLYAADAQLKSAIARQGDQIAEDQGYKGMYGMDAVYRYLIDKYHWLPDQVRRLSTDDINMLLCDYPKKKKS